MVTNDKDVANAPPSEKKRWHDMDMPYINFICQPNFPFYYICLILIWKTDSNQSQANVSNDKLGDTSTRVHFSWLLVVVKWANAERFLEPGLAWISKDKIRGPRSANNEIGFPFFRELNSIRAKRPRDKREIRESRVRGSVSTL